MPAYQPGSLPAAASDTRELATANRDPGSMAIPTPASTLPSSAKPNEVVLNYFSFFNVQGLNPLTKPSKVPYVKDLLLENNKIFIGLTERWLRDHFDGELQIEGYTLFRCDRRMTRSKYGRDSGGTAFFIKEKIASLFEPVIEYSDGVIEMLGLFSKENNSLLVVLYRTPDRPIWRSFWVVTSICLMLIGR